MYAVVNRGFGVENASSVAALRPAANGLFDMHGNADEWGEDWFEGPRGSRVLRGGSFNYVSPDNLRSANRDNYSPDDRNYGIGFRFSRTK
jgi:formylglycine-generating enzyme required for sulfatase activity